MSASLLRNLLLRQKRGGGGRTALEAAACRFGFQAATASAGGFFLFSLAQSPPLLIKCEPQASHSSPAAPAGGASGDKKGPMTMEQIKIALKEALGPIRNSYKHGSPPKVALRDSEGVFSATFPCFSWASSVKVIAAITKILAKHDNTILEVHSTSESLNMLSFVSRDGKGSLVYDGRSPDPKVTIFRDGGFSQTEIDAVTAGYKASLSSGSGIIQLQPPGSKLPSPASLGGSASGNGMQKLESMGVRVYDRTSDEPLEWDSLAGYDKVKREIEDTVVMPLQHPGLFDNIAQKTRARYESNRPRAVLLEGPPGTGKTLTARIIAQRCDMPMIHLGVDTVLSKWYGESERNIKQIWDACDSMGGAIIFVDEVDALAGSRDTGTMHEATRRVLSVILQKLEGFEGSSKSTLICATNRLQDLDAALLSRFQLTIRFDLPGREERASVFERYAKTLNKEEIRQLAASSHNMSCRDIKEICEHAERRWASLLIRGKVTNPVPDLQTYAGCLEEKAKGTFGNISAA